MFGTVDRPWFLLWEGEDNNSVHMSTLAYYGSDLTRMSSGRYTEEESMASDRFGPKDMKM